MGFLQEKEEDEDGGVPGRSGTEQLQHTATCCGLGMRERVTRRNSKQDHALVRDEKQSKTRKQNKTKKMDKTLKM